jgi:hypothetical protein
MRHPLSVVVNLIVIQHDDGTTTLYGHLTHDGAAVSAGDRVLQGPLVSHSGNTGNTNASPASLGRFVRPIGARHRELSDGADELPKHRGESARTATGTLIYGARLLADLRRRKGCRRTLTH